jgi:hypothetical protein
MSSRFIRSVLAQNEAVVASTVITYDLPVNPLSHILYTLRFLNSTGTITDYKTVLSALAQIAKIEVLYKGQAVISGSLQDIAIINWLMAGSQVDGTQEIKTTGNSRTTTVKISLGRKPFSPTECFPGIRKGELQLQITYAAALAGLATLTAQIETVELPEANPGAFLKYTTITKTPSATGEHDVDLPIGNKILAALLWGTTVPAAASYNASISWVKVLLDNMEYGYGKANWPTLHAEMGSAYKPYQLPDHYHRGNFTTTVEGDTGDKETSANLLQQYAFLDYDPLDDDAYAIETAGHSRIHLRINADVADAIRIIPVELIAVG